MDKILKWFLIFLFGIGCGYAWCWEQYQGLKPMMETISRDQGAIALELRDLGTRMQIVETYVIPKGGGKYGKSTYERK